jgi:uncharacterized protein YjbI with pentapeptide repeats
MASKFGKLWQTVRQHWVAIGVVGIGFVVVVALIIFGYRLDWTGFNGNIKSGKTLWDWLQLLIIPIMLAIGGFWLNQIQKSREEKTTELRTKIEREVAEKHAQTEREIALDNQRAAILQGYIDKMSELLLHEKLRVSQPEDEVRKLARVRTLTVLPRLDGKRKGSVLQFLHESGLIETDECIIDLNGADLRETELCNAELGNASLNKANLCGAILNDTILIGAGLNEANLSRASLVGACLSGASLCSAVMRNADLRDAMVEETDLYNADLEEANLSKASLIRANLKIAKLKKASLFGANLSEANLKDAIHITNEMLEKQARSLKGAIMPDGSIHP